IARRRGTPPPQWPEDREATAVAVQESPFYLRLVVRDRPGIIASLATIFSSHGINIDAVLQEPASTKDALPFVVTLEKCSSASMDAALADIGRLDFHVQPPLCLPVLA